MFNISTSSGSELCLHSYGCTKSSHIVISYCSDWCFSLIISLLCCMHLEMTSVYGLCVEHEDSFHDISVCFFSSVCECAPWVSCIIKAHVKTDGVLFFHYIDMCRDEWLVSTSRIQHWEPELTTMAETIFEKNSLAHVTNMEEVEYIQEVTRKVIVLHFTPPQEKNSSQGSRFLSIAAFFMQLKINYMWQYWIIGEESNFSFYHF